MSFYYYNLISVSHRLVEIVKSASSSVSLKWTSRNTTVERERCRTTSSPSLKMIFRNAKYLAERFPKLTLLGLTFFGAAEISRNFLSTSYRRVYFTTGRDHPKKCVFSFLTVQRFRIIYGGTIISEEFSTKNFIDGSTDSYWSTWKELFCKTRVLNFWTGSQTTS